MTPVYSLPLYPIFMFRFSDLRRYRVFHVLRLCAGLLFSLCAFELGPVLPRSPPYSPEDVPFQP